MFSSAARQRRYISKLAKKTLSTERYAEWWPWESRNNDRSSFLDPLNPSVSLARRQLTIYPQPTPPDLNEKDRLLWQEQQMQQQQAALLGVSTTTFFPKEPHTSFILALLTVIPVFIGLVILTVLCFGGPAYLSSGSNYLLYLSSANDTAVGDAEQIWLGLSGYCFQKGDSRKTCLTSPFNTMYTKAYNSTQVGSLRPFLPNNYGMPASLLLVCLISVLVCVIFMAWGAMDIRTAEVLEHRRRRRWVREWLEARRLECFACAFAILGIATGASATLTLASSTSVTHSTIITLGPLLSDTSFKTAKIGSVVLSLGVAVGLAGLSTFLQLLILAYDGLARRLRLEYESLVHDLDGFSRDDFVVAQRHLNKMVELAQRMDASPPDIRENIRQSLLQYMLANDVANTLARQEQLLMAQRAEFANINSKAQMPTMMPMGMTPTMAPIMPV